MVWECEFANFQVFFAGWLLFSQVFPNFVYDAHAQLAHSNVNQIVLKKLKKYTKFVWI